jgi:predicted glycoside hydrolase/deacetylase ChbG (UPF0249 family)
VSRPLIVNADDFGRSAGTNDGIIRAHRHGIVTSASLMVRRSAAVAAAEYARQQPSISIGLHLDLSEWSYRQDQSVLVYELADRARRLGVPLRERSSAAYCGDFYGRSGKGQPSPEAIEVDALIAIIERLPEGITELGCHPGLDASLDSSYRLERLKEVETLCDPRVRDALIRERITLRSF